MPRCHISQDLKARILILFYEQEPRSKGDMQDPWNPEVTSLSISLVLQGLRYRTQSSCTSRDIRNQWRRWRVLIPIFSAARTGTIRSSMLVWPAAHLTVAVSRRHIVTALSTAHNLFRILKLRNAEGLLCARTEEDIFKEEFDRLRSTEKMFSSTNVWGPPARRQRRSWGDSKGRTGGLNQLPPTSVYYCSSGIKKLSNWFNYS